MSSKVMKVHFISYSEWIYSKKSHNLILNSLKEINTLNNFSWTSKNGYVK